MDHDEFTSGPVDKIRPLPVIRDRELYLTETHEAILKYFRKRGSKTKVSFDDVVEAVGIPHDELQKHVHELHDAGHLESSATHFWLA